MADLQALTVRFIRALAIAGISVMSVCIFATLVIYAGNSTEFTTSFADVIVVILPFALAVTAALGCASLVMTGSGYARYEAMLSALAVLLWAQGNILVWRYGVFDGTGIDWLAAPWRGLVDIALWCAVLWLAIHSHRRFGRLLLVAAVVTLLVQSVAAISTLAAEPALLEARDVTENNDGREAAIRFSPEKNIVHIVMDGFQADIFAEILADTSERDVKSELRGFTYFNNHLGAYPYTQLTLPAMLSGVLFRNEVPVEAFIEKTMRGPTILGAALAAGYDVDIAAPVALKNVYTLGGYTNAYGISKSGHVDKSDYARSDAAKLVDLALFRVVPHFAKALVYRDEMWVFQAWAQDGAYLQMQYFSDLAFLSELAADMSVDRGTPVYKLIHVMLSHRPFAGNTRCEFDGRKSNSRGDVRTHAQCGLLRVLALLQRMKDLGIYDSSLIVLMADHGAWVPVEGFPATTTVDGMLVAMATPVLAIKPPEMRHAFQISNVPSSITDLPATIADVANFNVQFDGESVFSLQPEARRRRQHIVYGYGLNPDAPGYLFPMQQFLLNGSPYDPDAWQKGERYVGGQH